MSEARINTALRFNVRSLLALTTSAAFTMAVTRPFLTDLSRLRYGLILGLLLLLGMIVAFSTALTIRRRKKVAQQCGALLVTLPIGSLRVARIGGWAWLLFAPPLLISPFLYLLVTFPTPTAATPPITFMELWPLLFAMILLLQQVGLVGTWGVLILAEGYTNCVEVCEKGIVLLDKFYAWSSPKIRDLYIRKSNNDFVLNVKGFVRSIGVPEEQQELVRSILETHYQRPKPPDPFA